MIVQKGQSASALNQCSQTQTEVARLLALIEPLNGPDAPSYRAGTENSIFQSRYEPEEKRTG